jgi:hypothetical protein
MVLEKLVYSPFNHLAWLLAPEYFIELKERLEKQKVSVSVFAGFRCGVNEICTLWGFYAA